MLNQAKATPRPWEIEKPFGEYRAMKCELCEGSGYLKSFDMQKKRTETQRCDECAIFKSDAEARKAEANANK